MIIFIYGEDTYRAREKLKEIVGEYKKKNKSLLSLKFFDFSRKEEQNFSDFREGVRQTSMFREKKLQVVINPFLNAGFKEEFLKEAKEFVDSEDIIVIYEEGNIKKGDVLLKFLEKNAKSQEFKLLNGQNLKNWTKKEIEKRGGVIDDIALLTLIDYIGDDLWRMANEMQKLVNFKKGKTRPAKNGARLARLADALAKRAPDGSGAAITVADIKLLVKPKIETDIFKTIDAIAQKDKKQALSLLYQHLENGDSPLYLLSMIGYQFRNLLIVKELIEKNKPYGLIIKKSGLHPFVVKKSYSQSRQFTFPELKKIYQKIFQVDFDIKTGKIEQEVALELLVATI